MRVALISHGLTPYERTGVETHVARSAALLARAGHEVLVFVRRAAGGVPHLAERVELRDGYHVHWLEDRVGTRDAAEAQDPPGVVDAFADFLDRERPDVCHFHHLRGLGPGCLAVARERGIPTVFTAHDFGAVCHRTTMLRPDLSRCGVVGDTNACARCDLATSYLNEQQDLGDWQAGAGPAQLGPRRAHALNDLLRGAEPVGLASALAARAELERARLEALRTLDVVLAPSRTVAARLVEWGLDPECVRAFECGVDSEGLRDLPGPWSDSEQPLRFGFVGGTSKHKGLGELLEAFADVRGPVHLDVFGDSTDRPHVEHLRRLAQHVGAVWHGAFAAVNLPAVLGAIDVLCVPSQWEENAPFVVREALAAGRPVVASRLGGLVESVRDGRDGVLVEAGDRAAWTRALQRLAGDRGRVLDLAAGTRRPPALVEQSRLLTELYAGLFDRRSVPSPAAELAHLMPFAERHRALSALSLDALAELVASGVERLARSLGVEPPAVEREVDEDVRARLRDERRRAEWFERRAAADALARADLASEAEWLRRECETRDEELTWLHDQLAHRAAELERLRENLADVRAELEGRRQEASANAVEHERVRSDLAALRAHEEWLANQARDLVARLGALEPVGSEPLDRARLAQALADARDRLAQLDAEVEWRRAEMEAARDEGGAVLRSIVRRSGLGRRLAGWEGDA